MNSIWDLNSKIIQMSTFLVTVDFCYHEDGRLIIPSVDFELSLYSDQLSVLFCYNDILA